MKKQNMPIEIMMDNQNKLMDTITTNAMKAMEVFKMEDNWSKKGKEMYENFLKEQKQLAEKAMQPASYEKGLESMTEQMTKTMELNWNFANQTMNLYRDAMTAMTDGKSENPFNRMFELFNDNMHAMMDTTKKNMEAFRQVNWN
jgi:hypothetical protein